MFMVIVYFDTCEDGRLSPNCMGMQDYRIFAVCVHVKYETLCKLIVDSADDNWLYLNFCFPSKIKTILGKIIQNISKWRLLKNSPSMLSVKTFVLRFYGPVNPDGSCRAQSIYLTGQA